MGDSLQDQLVKAGLADPEQARARERGGGRRGQPKGKPTGKGKGKGRGKPAAGKQRAGPADAGASTRATQDRPAKPAGRRERVAQLRRLVKARRLDRSKAAVPYRFTSGRRIKEVTVTEEQQGRLARGEAAVVNVEGHYDVVPADCVAEVRALDEKAIVVFNEPGAGDSSGDGDPYTDHPVPDDLTW
jgi:hypothetical protein